MTFRAVTPEGLDWIARPHGEGEPARYVAELNDLLSLTHVPASLWRYEPGAWGRRHRHADQEETFVVLSGTLTMYLGEPPERVDLPVGSVINVAAMTPLQTANHGSEDLIVYAYGYPPDEGAEVLEFADPEI